MARHLELRPLTRSERRVLQSKLRDLTLSVRVHQRYRVIDQVRRGFSLLMTAERVGCHFTVAYDWVHRFNESGFGTFEQVPNPKGRPPILRSGQLRELIEVALSSPAERGLPFSVWSVPKLAEYCRRQRLLPSVTDEWVRRLLRREGLSAQRVRTWKTSTDPDFERKKNASGRSIGAVHRTAR
jgi:transposase